MCRRRNWTNFVVWPQEILNHRCLQVNSALNTNIKMFLYMWWVCFHVQSAAWTHCFNCFHLLHQVYITKFTNTFNTLWINYTFCCLWRKDLHFETWDTLWNAVCNKWFTIWGFILIRQQLLVKIFLSSCKKCNRFQRFKVHVETHLPPGVNCRASSWSDHREVASNQDIKRPN